MKLTRKTLLTVLVLFLFSGSIILSAMNLIFSPEGNTLTTTDEIAVFETTKGTIEIALNRDAAPITVANFVDYVEAGFYDGVVFHRVIDGFMIQTGGLTKKGEHKETNDPIENEANNGLKNVKGSVAMARTSAPHSASSQFFINHGDNSFLDYPGQDGWGYCVFGTVIKGMDVVDEIAAVETGTMNLEFGIMQDWPIEDVIITRAYMKEN